MLRVVGMLGDRTDWTRDGAYDALNDLLMGDRMEGFFGRIEATMAKLSTMSRADIDAVLWTALLAEHEAEDAANQN